MSEEWNTLKSGCEQVVIWQDGSDDSTPEPALVLRGYDPRLIEIMQGDDSIMINYETLPALIKAMKRLAK